MKTIVYLSSSIIPEVASELTSKLKQNNISVRLIKEPNNMWVRDYLPAVNKDGNLVRYIYRPDYLLESERYKKMIVDANGFAEKEFCKTHINLDVVLDGGNIVQLGDDYVAMTEKAMAENPKLSREELEHRISDAFHCKVLWLPWDKKEIYGHADGMVNWCDGKVIMTNYSDFDPSIAKEIHRRLNKAGFDVVELKYIFRHGFHSRSWCYVNFLQTDNVIFLPKLGVDEDEEAKEQISAVTSKRIETVNVLPLVRRGGALHCATWEYIEK